MALGKIVRDVRRKLALFIFGLFLVWPLIHIVLVNSTRISSWRLFGWGMYASPNPDQQARLRVVILNQPINNHDDIRKLHTALQQLQTDPAQESFCLNLFSESGGILKKLPKQALCKEDRFAMDLDYFLHFGSSRHLGKFVGEALTRAQRVGAEALAFFTYQRFSLSERKAYVESEVYRIFGEKAVYVGKVKSEG